ncbi:hypothetical protein [Nitrobacter vulgaris]|uniref:hypothetical protein n=1 Tax=Nitrobacter vulgaris TaxID=29421 RepID=UPI001301D3A5
MDTGSPEETRQSKRVDHDDFESTRSGIERDHSNILTRDAAGNRYTFFSSRSRFSCAISFAAASLACSASAISRNSLRASVTPLAVVTARLGQIPKQPVITTRGRFSPLARLKAFSSDFSARLTAWPFAARLRHFLQISIGEGRRGRAVAGEIEFTMMSI